MRGKGPPPLSEGGTSSAVQFMLQNSPRDQIEASLSEATSSLSPSLQHLASFTPLLLKMPLSKTLGTRIHILGCVSREPSLRHSFLSVNGGYRGTSLWELLKTK